MSDSRTEENRLQDANIDVDSLDSLINQLPAAFIWESTPQGDAYWQTVLDNLESIRASYKSISHVNMGRNCGK